MMAWMMSMVAMGIPAGVDDGESFRYLALGDSYTIGESVAEERRWPNMLADDLQIDRPVIVAQTGWTTDELDQAIDQTVVDGTIEGEYDLVSLLVGVNDQYRGYPADEALKRFEALLHRAVGFAAGDVSRVFVVSIPDWLATPFGEASGRDTDQQSRQIDLYNEGQKMVAQRLGVKYFDITGHTRDLRGEKWVASDGLHPSGAMYRHWVDDFCPAVAAMQVAP